MAGVDPAHTGANPGPGPTGEPREEWQLVLPGAGRGGPIAANGSLYAGSSEAAPVGEIDRLYAVDAATGAQRWCVATGLSVAEPTFGDGLVFTEGCAITAGHFQHFVVALTAATGAEKWRAYVGWGVEGHAAGVTVADGTVYVATGLGDLFALDESTGEARWLVQIDEDADSADEYLSRPAIADGVVYVAGGQTLHALDAATGKEAWRFAADVEGEQLGAPTVADGIVYVGGNHTLSAVDAQSGDEVWRVASESAGGNRLAVVDGVLYLSTGSATEATGTASVSALDAKTGDQHWRFATEGYASTPAVVGDTVYVGTGTARANGEQDGAIRALAVADGEEIWSYPVDGIATTPIVIGGHVYAGAVSTHDDGATQTLYAIGGTTTAADLARKPR